jgi:integrase
VFFVFHGGAVRLLKTEIDALVCPPGRRDMIVFDEDLPGFGLRVTDDGSKVFLFQYRRGKLVRRLRLGRYGELTPAQARKLATAARGQVAGGGDPAAERDAAIAADEAVAAELRRQAAADELTLEKLISLWDTKQLVHRSGRYKHEAPRALRAGLPALLDKPAHSLDVGALQRALDAIPIRKRRKAPKSGKEVSPAPATRTGTMARRVRAYGSALYGWAIKRGLVPSNPFAAIPDESRDVQRDRVLTDAELADIWEAAGTLGWPWASFFRVLLLTLQRESEVAGMRWDELADDFSTWNLPGARTKNRKPHIVHLAEPARAILQTAPRRDQCALVFTTTGKTQISGFSKAKARLDAAIAKARLDADPKATPMPPWWLHDFRRTGVTVLARQGVRWEVADRLLNHVQGVIKGVAAIYQRHDYLEERQKALDLWASHVAGLAVSAPIVAET